MDQTNKARWRVVWLFCGMLAVCTVLMLRLYRLSMDSSLLQAAQSQGSYTLEVTTTRGRIYDRSLLPLTDTEQNRVLAVLPTPEAGQACAEQIEGPQRRTALDLIAQGSPFLIDVGSEGTVYSSDVENFIVSSRLPHDTSEQLAVHLIGYLDGEGKGVTGLEQAYEEPLSAAGQQVSVRCQMDALGQPMNSEGMQVTGDSTPPQEGVVLTLDRRMQRVVQRVGQQIEQGAIVVMDVQTGELAACASFPQYDPYNLEEALTDPDKPLLNRALMSYNVGSSFKLAVAPRRWRRAFPRPFRSTAWAASRWRAGFSTATTARAIRRPTYGAPSSSPATPILSSWGRLPAVSRFWGWQRPSALAARPSWPRD